MGRYVLLEFDDNVAADKFVESLQMAQEGTDGGVDRDFEAGMIAAAHSTVTAVFSKPGGLCKCEAQTKDSVRGKKFGWWVCPDCKRPKPRMGQVLPNMLDPEGVPTRNKEMNLSVKWLFDENGKVVTARTKMQD